MAKMIPLAAQPRDAQLTPKALRRQALVPGIMYGRDFAPMQLQFASLTLERTLSLAGTSHLIELSVEGSSGTHVVLVREVQRHPVTGRVLHVDLYRTLADVALRSEVPLVFVGAVTGAATAGLVTHLLDVIEVECLPQDMPSEIEVDLGRLRDLHAALAVGDLTIPANVTVLTDPDMEVVRIVPPRGLPVEEEVEEAPAPEEEELTETENGRE